ncbi:molybdopterin biosynthesis protein [Sulfitobacter sp. SK012]|uniref:molybdopterin-binding protein n=1 Tax=Sulfitobacter sp. SK012 TaxID=1389005 RepID=UPI000E0A84BB|nr:molybdopterin-binding protein [Sulfitobacter sp. SK012]AXI46995.1 molybdopterin biosynthesis protein [Sulfitobacter sp. SK012]
MRFGPILVKDACGSVLAHSVALSKGRLRKGHVLGIADLASLKDAGHAEVIVARLDSGDVDENAAADVLADALMADANGLRRTNAFTGRVNLIADGPGVAVLNVAALEAANAVDPMITIATVPPMLQMAEGGMVATIKIIAYAVGQAALEQAADAARGAIRVAQPVLKDATLIITEIPGGAGDKGRVAIENRLTALGVALNSVQMVPHRTDALSAAIAASNSPLVLILTGSATSDIKDVGPLALAQAGGHIERFGMPVDPGNLLFLGHKGSQIVIGLPGCARAPALNGADWVLSRVVCGIDVTARDIAAMGVGGLLKEIPTRPQPRNRPPK